MKLFKQGILFFSLLLAGGIAAAQDAVIIEDGNFVRGTIKAANTSVVTIATDDQTLKAFKAQDIKEFLWNGNSYISKPILNKNKMEHQFFKLEEYGAVNLYSLGQPASETVEEPREKRVRVMPSVGIGIGSGGYGGVGFGGGISIGGGVSRRKAKNPAKAGISYYIEKPGTGPLVALPLTASNKDEQIRAILLQKLSNDEDLAERIKATEGFDVRKVQTFISAYNKMQP